MAKPTDHSLIYPTMTKLVFVCDQCELQDASIACFSCVSQDDYDGEPVYYCSNCSECFHKGKKKNHSLLRIVNVENELQNYKSRLKRVTNTEQNCLDAIQKMKVEIVMKSEAMVTKFKSSFNELKELLEYKEKELLQHFDSVKEECLEVVEKEADKHAKSIQCSDQAMEDVTKCLSSTESYKEKHFLAISTKVNTIVDSSNDSLLKLNELLERLSFVPSVDVLKDMIRCYCIPHSTDWKIGDTKYVVGAPLASEVESYFWVTEYTVPTERLSHLKLISHTLTSIISSNTVHVPLHDCFRRGELCSVYLTSDKLWHRGLVEGIIPLSNQFIIRFLDYGFLLSVDAVNVRWLPQEVRNYPFQTRRCKFVEETETTVTWRSSLEAVSNYIEMTRSSKLVAFVCDKVISVDGLPLFTVQLHNDNGINIGREVLGKAKLNVGTPRESVDESKAVKLNVGTPRESVVVKECLDLFVSIHPRVVVGANLSLSVITGVEDSGEFWCRLVLNEKEDKVYSQLSDELQVKGSINISTNQLTFYQGDMCCAVFSEDGLFYRGLVLRQEKEGCILVRFIDYGNVEEVPVAKVTKLDVQYKMLSYQAFPCYLMTSTTAISDKEDYRNLIDALGGDTIDIIVVAVSKNGVVHVKMKENKVEGAAVSSKSTCESGKKIKMISVCVRDVPEEYFLHNVKQLFEEFGVVYDIRMVHGRGKGGKRIFFVDMEVEDALKAHRNLNKKVLGASMRPLYLDFDRQWLYTVRN